MIRIGFDVGGSKIAALALDRAGREVGRRRRDVPRDYGGTLAALAGDARGADPGARPCRGDRHRAAGA